MFFSEYMKGAAIIKLFEIYNDTGAAIDLAAGGYNIQMCLLMVMLRQGYTINLTGTVQTGMSMLLLTHPPVLHPRSSRPDQRLWLV